MSYLVRLYVLELTREGAVMTIEDVPAQLRAAVATALEAGEEATNE